MANLSKLSVARWAKWPSTISNICSTIDEADEVEVLHCNIECAEFSVQWYAQPSLYQCQLCQFEGDRKVMWQHVQKIHRPYECLFCGLTVTGSDRMAIHGNEHYVNQKIGAHATGYRIKQTKN